MKLGEGYLGFFIPPIYFCTCLKFRIIKVSLEDSDSELTL
jgi:hypothetical protein